MILSWQPVQVETAGVINRPTSITHWEARYPITLTLACGGKLPQSDTDELTDFICSGEIYSRQKSKKIWQHPKQVYMILLWWRVLGYLEYDSFQNYCGIPFPLFDFHSRLWFWYQLRYQAVGCMLISFECLAFTAYFWFCQSKEHWTALTISQIHIEEVYQRTDRTEITSVVAEI